MSNFELEQEKEDKARDLYQTYVSHYTSNLIYGTGEEEPIGRTMSVCVYIYMYTYTYSFSFFSFFSLLIKTICFFRCFCTNRVILLGLLVEHETIDITVPTRVDIKLRSRQIIEAQLKSE